MTWTDPSLMGWALGLVLAAWLAPRRFQVSAIAGVGAMFLAITDLRSFGLLLVLGLCAWFAMGRVWWRAAAAVIVGVVIGFKWGFRLGEAEVGFVPLGLSFFSLRVLHLLIDRSVGQKPRPGFGEMARYLAFLPTQVAGPINRYDDFERDTRRRRWDSGLFALGLERILYGYVKIVVLADYLVTGKMTVWLAGLPPDSWSAAYLGCVHSGLNLYLQFAGYSDVAIGVALLVGYRVPENFHWPFVAANIHDFWDRWHVTLSHWCRDYVFRPVAAATRSPHLGVVASMIVLGLWHELSWRFILWGVYHGFGIVVWRVFQGMKPERFDRSPIPFKRCCAVLGWLLTMNFVILSFALTRAADLAETWSIWVTVFGG